MHLNLMALCLKIVIGGMLLCVVSGVVILWLDIREMSRLYKLSTRRPVVKDLDPQKKS